MCPSPRARCRALSILLAASVFVLGACSESTGNNATTTPTALPRPDADADQATGSGSEPSPTTPSGPDCVLGTWTLDTASLSDTLSGLVRASDPDARAGITGTIAIAFSGTEMTVTYTDVTFTATSSAENASVTTQMSGMTVGAYDISDAAVAMDEGDVSGLVVIGTRTVDGTATDVTLEEPPLGLSGPYAYTCTNDTVQFDATPESAAAIDIPSYTLTRSGDTR